MGDRFLIKNPELSITQKIKPCDLVMPRNVTGEIYKIKLRKGNETYEKSVFKGQIVLFCDQEQNVDIDLPNTSQEQLTHQIIINEITDFGDEVRNDVFKSPHRYRCRAKIDHIQQNRKYFYETLDNGVLAKIYQQLKHVSKSNELKEKYVAMWE